MVILPPFPHFWSGAGVRGGSRAGCCLRQIRERRSPATVAAFWARIGNHLRSVAATGREPSAIGGRMAGEDVAQRPGPPALQACAVMGQSERRLYVRRRTLNWGGRCCQPQSSRPSALPESDASRRSLTAPGRRCTSPVAVRLQSPPLGVVVAGCRTLRRQLVRWRWCRCLEPTPTRATSAGLSGGFELRSPALAARR